jgi:hypothetical protein
VNLSIIKQHAEKFISDNATGILTAGGVVGVVTTSVLTARATFKASTILEVEMQRRIATEMQEPEDREPKMTTPEKVKMVWPHYIPPALSGGVTIAAIIMANRMNAQRIAALAAAYSISENRLKEFQKKVEAKLTGPKNQQIHDEIAQDRINANPPNREVIILDGKNVLCYDLFSGRYFNSTMQEIKAAELSTNAEIYNHDYASLSYFYDELEIAPTGYSDLVGWNSATTGPMELRFSTVMSPDMKPCLSVDFAVSPVMNYSQLY